MNSNIFRLNIKDVIKGLVVVLLVVVLGALQQALGEHGLEIAAYDWGSIIDIAWKAGIAYLGKNLISTDTGKVLGKI